MKFIPGNAQNIGGRDYQQDSFGFSDPADAEFARHGGFLAIVADGMGGMEHGDAASRAAVKVFLDSYRTKTAEESIPDALTRSIVDANRAVSELSHEMGAADGIGTTFIAVALKDSEMYWISVGDSAIYRYRDGILSLLTYPHVFANILEKAVARGVLSSEDAARHPERESLTSYIGAKSIEEIDRNQVPYPIQVGDQILLCSDGLFKTLSLEEIVGNISPSLEPQQSCDQLVQATLSKHRDHQDNVTAVIIGIAEPPAPLAPPPGPPSAKRTWILLALLVLAAGVLLAWWLFRATPRPKHSISSPTRRIALIEPSAKG